MTLNNSNYSSQGVFKMINDKLNLSGKLKIDHYDSSMNLIDSKNLNNLIVTQGKIWIMSRAIGNTTSLMTRIGIGAGTNPPALTDTSLQTQIGPRSSLDSVSQNDNQATYVATFGPVSYDTTITEAGLFSAASGGIMLSRVLFTAINKSAADTIVISWVITLN